MFSKSDKKANAEVIDVKSDDMSTIAPETELPPPPPYSLVGETSTPGYEVKYKDWKCTRALINDPESHTTVYTAELPSLRRSHINLKTASDDLQIATSNPYNMRKYIAASVRGQDIALRYESFWKCSYSFVSPAFNNAKLTWVCRSKMMTDMEYVLLDEHSTPLARWKISGSKVGPFKDLGSVEFFGGRVESQTAKEEVLMTGFTVIFLEIVARSNGTMGVSALSTMAAVAAKSS